MVECFYRQFLPIGGVNFQWARILNRDCDNGKNGYHSVFELQESFGDRHLELLGSEDNLDTCISLRGWSRPSPTSIRTRRAGWPHRRIRHPRHSFISQGTSHALSRETRRLGVVSRVVGPSRPGAARRCGRHRW